MCSPCRRAVSTSWRSTPTTDPSGWCDEENARLYDDTGLRAAAAALRDGGVAVFWSPDRSPRFEAALDGVFASVSLEEACDDVGERRFTYTMYVCRA